MAGIASSTPYVKLDGESGAAFVSFASDAAGRAGSSGVPNATNEEEQQSSLCPGLSLKERLIGFGICAGVGFLFSLFSWVAVFRRQFGTFAIIYTLSNVFAIGSTFFLCGPARQWRNMIHPTRWIATAVYLVAMVITFIVGIAAKVAWVTVLTILIQYLAGMWYCISYIPFAREMVWGYLGLRSPS